MSASGGGGGAAGGLEQLSPGGTSRRHGGPSAGTPDRTVGHRRFWVGRMLGRSASPQHQNNGLVVHPEHWSRQAAGVGEEAVDNSTPPVLCLSHSGGGSSFYGIAPLKGLIYIANSWRPLPDSNRCCRRERAEIVAFALSMVHEQPICAQTSMAPVADGTRTFADGLRTPVGHRNARSCVTTGVPCKRFFLI